MKRHLYILFVFVLMMFGPSRASAQSCITPYQQLLFTTWVDGVLACLEQKPEQIKSGALKKLSKKLIEHLRTETSKTKLLDGASALIWIIHHQERNGNQVAIKQNEEHVFRILETAQSTAYDCAKTLLPLAGVWAEYNDQVRLRALLKELLAYVPRIPQLTLRHENAQRMVLLSILDLQKQGGMDEWSQATRVKYQHLLIPK